MKMHPEAALAIKAAQGYHKWGPYMARCFARRNEVPPKLIRIARQLEAEGAL